ncbi:methyl-accepting chemotaxis protein [Halobellus ordinarius]|uniref:methyl-accepting chemotaxis protein n=1 Tax=Halobellus ordinarius TaxID=3075120 RepID=UPI0028802E3E|nr:methyl-accepting chemotaxis protein [Halobellus sp. ZY16]
MAGSTTDAGVDSPGLIGGGGGVVSEIIKYTPSGDSIPAETWRGRHRKVLVLLLAHTPLLLLLGLYEGTESVLTGATIPAFSVPEVGLGIGTIVAFIVLASVSRFGRRTRTTFATLGLATSSAVLVYFSGGYIEAHFHFFVVMAVVAVYEDWLPFLVGIVYVAVQHGYFGMTTPGLVYNHAAAINNPFAWAMIHATFVLFLAAALMSNWYSIERSREETEKQLQQTQEVEEARADAEARQQEVEELNAHLETKADDFSATMAKAADGDLGVRLDPDSDSEAMTQVAEAFNEMIEEMEPTMREVQTVAGEVTVASEEADAGTDEVRQASGEVTDAIQNISGGTDEQREMLEEVYGEMTDLSATVEEVAASAETVAETSHETAEIAETGEMTAQRAIDDARDAQSAIDSTVDNVERLEDRMTEIGEIVELISDIAEQTNLLALNANIEAARVGNGTGTANGDGFAVVADEVKQLAEETQESANEIEELIQETQAQTGTTVSEARAAKEYMQEGVEAVEEVLDAFTQVATNAEETDSGIQEISDATDDQAETAEETVSMVERAAEISRTTADDAQDVSAAAEEQASSISQVSANVESLAEQAEQLQSLLSAFEAGGTTGEPAGRDPDPTATSGSSVAVGDGGTPE